MRNARSIVLVRLMMDLARPLALGLVLTGCFGIIPSKFALAEISPIAQNTQNRKAEADRLIEQSNQKIDQEQFQAAIDLAQKALVIYRAISDRKGEGSTLKTIGNAHNGLQNFPKSIEYQQQALAIAKDIKDTNLAALALNNIGLIYRLMGKFEQGIPYLKEAIVVAQASQHHTATVLAMGNLAASYEGLGQKKQAIEMQKQSLATVRKHLKDSPQEVRTLMQLSNTLVQLSDGINDYRAASDLAEEAVVVAKKLKNQSTLFHALIFLQRVNYLVVANEIEQGQ